MLAPNGNKQTLNQEEEAEDAGVNREPDYTVLYTLYDVFVKHIGSVEAVYHETLISRPTLRKHRDANTLDHIIFILCPDGITRIFFQKPPSKYAQ